jgi:hypothetical protein
LKPYNRFGSVVQRGVLLLEAKTALLSVVLKQGYVARGFEIGHGNRLLFLSFFTFQETAITDYDMIS